MSYWREAWVIALMFAIGAPAIAQVSEADSEANRREAERQLADSQRELAQAALQLERQRREREAVMRDERIEVEIRMKEAEAALAEAAQHVAELSMRQLPRIASVERIMRTGRGPMLGVTIGGNDDDGPVEGVEIQGITPGGAAEEAGLRAGDIITAINDESLTANSSRAANEKLLDFMVGVEEGDELDVEYLRDGRTASVELAPRSMGNGVFAFQFDGQDFNMPEVHVAPNIRSFGGTWIVGGNGLGDMEMVKLTERLGSYFGTDEGVLIVRGPKNEDLQLQDGDVIQSIDGRKPTSVKHAVRILRSYESGETVTIEIMRDKRKQTLSIEVPDNRRSSLSPAVAPEVRVTPRVKVVRSVEERT